VLTYFFDRFLFPDESQELIFSFIPQVKSSSHFALIEGAGKACRHGRGSPEESICTEDTRTRFKSAKFFPNIQKSWQSSKFSIFQKSSSGLQQSSECQVNSR
jgi:hypothetical protein